jgi:hypothetical protein
MSAPDHRATYQIFPTGVQWLRAGAPTTSAYTFASLYGTAQGRGTYTVAAYPTAVFYDVDTCLLEPLGTPAAILAAAGKPGAICIITCRTQAAATCRCGTHMPADLAECVFCTLERQDAQEGGSHLRLPQAEEEEDYEEADDDEDCSICVQCLRTFYGEGFHGFCGSTCAAARHGKICHCCYE